MLERRLHRVPGAIGELAQLLGAERDLSTTRCDEEAKCGGGGVALVGGQLGQNVVEVGAHDRVGAAQTPQRLQPQALGAGRDLLVPEALHDELEVGRLHPDWAGGDDFARAVATDDDPPAAHLLEHRVHELGLDFEVLGIRRQLPVERVDGFKDRRPSGALVQEVEMQVVAVDVGDARLEPIADQGVGVLADGDQEVRPQVAASYATRELIVEPFLIGRLVEEVLLELVEDQEHRGVRRSRDILDGMFQGVASECELPVIVQQRPHGGFERGDRRSLRIASPRAEDHGEIAHRVPLFHAALRELAQSGRHAGAQERALPDTAFGVKQRQP